MLKFVEFNKTPAGIAASLEKHKSKSLFGIESKKSAQREKEQSHLPLFRLVVWQTQIVPTWT